MFNNIERPRSVAKHLIGFHVDEITLNGLITIECDQSKKTSRENTF